jgi:outer membrane protein assembly factor BamB/ABC-type phosphate/phosphonate transport system substrate-binding protein
VRLLNASFAALFAAVVLAGCGRSKDPWVMLVMDPLARELACPCVGGYAQRDYRALATFLSRTTGRHLEAVFADELGKGLRLAGQRPVALIVGKDSLVRCDAAERRLAIAPLCRLTDRDGKTSLTGLFVVGKDDPAQKLSDLQGRPVFFGPADSDEKHRAALAALQAAGVPVPDKPETRPGCSEAAACVVESTNHPAPAGVISSYAFPLLEGCGNVPPGALRIVGETKSVPFVTVFTTAAASPQFAERLLAAFLRVRGDATLLKRMESKFGFVAHEAAATALGDSDWPDWRGPRRDGHIARLPAGLPAEARFAWRKPLSGPGLAGLAATTNLVFVADRDPLDERDAFFAFRTTDGELVWQLDYPAKADLDYGHSPRATPLVRDGRVYLLGAGGQLHCVEAIAGKVIWKCDLARDFGATIPKWGYCSTPLFVDGRLIVNPGASNASLVALEASSGKVVWQSPGAPPAYGAFILADLGGRRQIVGHDQVSLGGWDARTGRRLWTLVPPKSGDFNVPTPVAHEGRLVVATENNGARLYGFRDDGTIIPEPVCHTDALAAETSSPVIVGGLVFGWDNTLRCLDIGDGLNEIWSLSASASGTHASFLAGDGDLLVVTDAGELLLLKVAGRPTLVSRLRIAPADTGGYAHPALAADHLFVRDRTHLLCLVLK